MKHLGDEHRLVLEVRHVVLVPRKQRKFAEILRLIRN